MSLNNSSLPYLVTAQSMKWLGQANYKISKLERNLTLEVHKFCKFTLYLQGKFCSYNLHELEYIPCFKYH